MHRMPRVEFPNHLIGRNVAGRFSQRGVDARQRPPGPCVAATFDFDEDHFAAICPRTKCVAYHFRAIVDFVGQRFNRRLLGATVDLRPSLNRFIDRFAMQQIAGGAAAAVEGTNLSSVPWKCSTGTGRVGWQSSKQSVPAIGAICRDPVRHLRGKAITHHSAVGNARGKHPFRVDVDYRSQIVQQRADEFHIVGRLASEHYLVAAARIPEQCCFSNAGAVGIDGNEVVFIGGAIEPAVQGCNWSIRPAPCSTSTTGVGVFGSYFGGT